MEFARTLLGNAWRLGPEALATCVMTMALLAGQARAQESSSRPDGRPAAASSNLPSTPTAKGTAAVNAPVDANGPSAALRDVLLAACAQSGGDFSRFLTARSKQSFGRLTPAARVALMKRFVLLNVPGNASTSANPAGRPIVRCETPGVTTEMSIGGADVRDNIAFMPLELRDANDSTGASAHQVIMGLVREDGQWRLLSLGLLLLDLPALEVEWDSAEANANEGTALENLKQLEVAVETYRRRYASLPESLASLGPALRGAPLKSGAAPDKPAATRDAAGLVDAELAAGNKDGYVFRIVIAGASGLGAPAKYALAATPSAYGRTGTKSFFRDAEGGLHAADHGGAVGSERDPAIK
jgi:hypothetical protein